MDSLPIRQFRLSHGYSFTEPLELQEFDRDNVVVGGSGEGIPREAMFLGKLAEFDRMRANVWLDLEGAHAIYVMGKRRSGKTFTLGALAENLASTQWIKRGGNSQAVLVLDTMNVFSTMPFSVADVHSSDSHEGKEQLQWGLAAENLPVTLYYPKGTERPPEGNSHEFSLRPSDLTAEDWAGLLGVDTFSEPIGQLVAEVYEQVVVEGYESISGTKHPPCKEYRIDDFIDCIDESSNVGRFEQRTREAARRYLRAINRLEVFSDQGTDIAQLFSAGQISVVLLRDLDHHLRGLMIGVLVKKIMEGRGVADKYERLSDVFETTAKHKTDPQDKENAKKKQDEYTELARNGLPRGWILIDEAHNYMPAKGIVASKVPLRKYVNEGRNLGLSIVVATQHPAGLDPAIQRNADILLMHSMSMGDDIAATEKMVNTFVPDAFVYDTKDQVTARVFDRMIRTIDLGFAVVASERASRVFPVRVRPRITIHGGERY